MFVGHNQRIRNWSTIQTLKKLRHIQMTKREFTLKRLREKKRIFLLHGCGTQRGQGMRLWPPEFNLPDLDGVAGGSGRLELEHDEMGGSVREGEGRVDEAVQRRWGTRGPRRGKRKGGGEETVHEGSESGSHLLLRLLS